MKTTTLRMPVETAALARSLLQHTTAPNLGRLLNDLLIDRARSLVEDRKAMAAHLRAALTDALHRAEAVDLDRPGRVRGHHHPDLIR